MHHSLCDAVLGQSKSQIILEELVDNNQFIISSDDQKSKYRYHRMFKEVLVNQQKRLDLEELQEIHTRAAIWLEEHGEIESSFKHWISAKGADEAAMMLIRNGPKMLGEFQRPIFIDLTNSLPREVVLRWPWLSVYRAWCSAIYDSQSVQTWLGLAEDGIKRIKSMGEEIADENELMGNIIAIEVIQASMVGDREKTIQLAEKALTLLPEQATNVRGLVHKAIGTSAQSNFDLDSALEEYLQSVSELRKRKNLVGAIDSQNMAGDILRIQGKLHKANKMYRETLTFDESQDQDNLPFFSKSISEIGLILYEWNRLEEAFDNLVRGYKLSKIIGGPSQVEIGINLVSSYLTLGEIEKAAEYLKEIEAVTQWKSFFPYLESHLAAVKLHFLSKTNNLLEAKRIINERSIQCDCLVDFYQEIECMALAYHFYYSGDMLSSIDLASKLSKCMEEGERNGRRIKMLVLEASAQLTLQHRDRAIELINLALEIGQQGTYIRTFVDQGEPILEILVWVLNKFSKVTNLQIDLEYLRLIIDAFLGQSAKPSSQIQVRTPDIDKKNLIDPLTEREQKVLQMMSIGLSNKEIAKELELTVHTIKTHARHIYRKLAVSNRTQAVHKGKILGII
jgi:LuxR family maltose regulon positive regulatory protein